MGILFRRLPFQKWISRNSSLYLRKRVLKFCGQGRGSWWGVPNPSSQLIFSPNPGSQLLNFLKSQSNILECLPIRKYQLILGKQSQFSASCEGQSQVPVNRHQDPPHSLFSEGLGVPSILFLAEKFLDSTYFPERVLHFFPFQMVLQFFPLEKSLRFFPLGFLHPRPD